MEEYFNDDYIRDMICMVLFRFGLALIVISVLMGIVFKRKCISDLLFHMRLFAAFIFLCCISYAIMGIEFKEATSSALSLFSPIIIMLGVLISIGVIIILYMSQKNELERGYMVFHKILFYPVTISRDHDITGNHETHECRDLAISLETNRFRKFYLKHNDIIGICGFRYDPETADVCCPVTLDEMTLRKIFKGKKGICLQIKDKIETWTRNIPTQEDRLVIEYIIEYVTSSEWK